MVQFDDQDLASLEPKLHKIFKRELGFYESDILNHTLKLINKGVDKRTLESQLSMIIDKKKAPKLSDEIWNFMDEYNLIKEAETSGGESLLGKRSRERTQDEENYTESSKKKKYDRAHAYDKASLDRIQKAPEKKVKEEETGTTAGGEGGVKKEGEDGKPFKPPTKEEISEMLKKTQQMIEARKKSLSVKPEVKAEPPPSGAMAAIAALQASIAAKMSKVNLPAKPVPLIIDDRGRTVDSSGQAIQLTAHVPTLKANQRAQEKKTEFTKAPKEVIKPQVEETTFQDPRIGQRGAFRQSRKLNFHEAGKFQAEAQRLRMKNQLEKLQSEISVNARKTGISSATQLAKLVPKGPKSEKEPDIEWWDQVILGSSDYEDWKLRDGAITSLIEHPIQLKPLEDNRPVSVPMFLTKQEQKKLRRQNRREAWKEKQDKVRLGLILPEEAKVKMSNLMRVLGHEQVLDPTKVEAQVRAQMAKRKADHEAANEERKLTPAERKEKNARKLKEDTTFGVHVAVYRLKNLHNPAKKWKLEKNAQQLYMTGTVVLFQDVNVVVVEGGPKQLKKYKQLMMTRIKWEEDTYKDKEGEEHNNLCELVWEGETKQRNFGDIKFKMCTTEGVARDHFKAAGVEHYWDQAYGTAVLASAES